MDNKNIQENINNNFLLGSIKYQGLYKFYLMPLAYWILNYEKYDPTYNPNDWEFVFRDNILNVVDINVTSFLNSIKEDEVFLSNDEVEKYNLKDQLLFFVDLDKKLFINFFYDVEIEEYLPDSKWTGKFENPINYLPRNTQRLFL